MLHERQRTGEREHPSVRLVIVIGSTNAFQCLGDAVSLIQLVDVRKPPERREVDLLEADGFWRA